MEIDFNLELSYGDDAPDDTVTPTTEDIARFVREGMEREGLSSADISVERAQ